MAKNPENSDPTLARKPVKIDFVEKARAAMEARLVENPKLAQRALQALQEDTTIKAVVQEVKDALAKVPPEQIPFSFMPTDMTRLSPFFPIADNDKKRYEYKEMTWDNSWGRMTIKGLQLSVYDEDILLSLLTLFKVRDTLTTDVSKRAILKAIGKSYGRAASIALEKSLDRLLGTVVVLEKWDNIKTKNPTTKMANTILIGYSVNPSGTMKISLNPYFKEAYLESMVTSIDIAFRMSLKHDTSKCLLRFLSGQGDDYSIGLDKLVPLINLNPNQERRRVRASVRIALKELKEKKYLEVAELKRDVIYTKKYKPAKKALPA